MQDCRLLRATRDPFRGAKPKAALNLLAAMIRCHESKNSETFYNINYQSRSLFSEFDLAGFNFFSLFFSDFGYGARQNSNKQKRFTRNARKKKATPARNRTPISRVIGGDTHHYTTEEHGLEMANTLVYILYFSH